MTEKEHGYYNRRLEYVVESGTFHVFVTDGTAPVGVEPEKPENLPCVVYRERTK